MLVKELRQGLRGVGFVILFITLQALLAFILLITAGAASSDNAGHLLSRTIFFLFSFAVLIVQPCVVYQLYHLKLEEIQLISSV